MTKAGNTKRKPEPFSKQGKKGEEKHLAGSVLSAEKTELHGGLSALLCLYKSLHLSKNFPHIHDFRLLHIGCKMSASKLFTMAATKNYELAKEFKQDTLKVFSVKRGRVLPSYGGVETWLVVYYS